MITPEPTRISTPSAAAGDVLELLVAVAVLGVGRLLGLAHGEERDQRRDQVDARVDRLGEDRHRAGDRARERA
jgi:hypothetical protein